MSGSSFVNKKRTSFDYNDDGTQQKINRKKGSRQDVNNPIESNNTCLWDTTGIVSATLFGIHRLTEMKDLWYSSSNTTNHNNIIPTVMKSGGKKISSRHLRRRATSYKPKRRRYRQQQQQQQMTTKKKKDDDNDNNQHTTTRRAKRQNKSILQSQHEIWKQYQHNITTCYDDDDDANSNTTTSNINWMTTHIWHTKRFHMNILFDWKVPILHTNRGCSAALRLVQYNQKCLIQDVTWCMQPIYIHNSNKNDTNNFYNTISRIIPNFQQQQQQQQQKNDDNIKLLWSSEGIIYKPDCFPISAIGPITWIVINNTSIYLFVHPSIRTRTIKYLQQLQLLNNTTTDNTENDNDSNNNTGNNNNNNNCNINCIQCCFSLRGLTSWDCLKLVLLKHYGWNENDLLSSKLLNSIKDNNNDHGDIIQIQLYQNNNDNTNVSSSSHDNNINNLYIRIIQPRDPTISIANIGVCGIDIYCHYNISKNLFIYLIITGGACPIGYTEQTYIQLECDPPIPTFPRDSPDTNDGILYWNNNKANDKENNCWNDIRHYWEGGGGRIRRSNNSNTNNLKVINWLDLVNSDPVKQSNIDDIDHNSKSHNNTSEIVVIRGTFAEPLQNILQNSALLPPETDTTTKPTRRNRRKVSNNSFVSTAMKLSDEAELVHQQNCKNLVQSLTIPGATVLCHIQVIGKGTLQPGSKIITDNNDNNNSNEDNNIIILGYVTAAAFSPSRGRYHGMAIIGTAKFLQHIIATTTNAITNKKYYHLVRQLDKSKTIELGVKVLYDNNNNNVEATKCSLSIILS